MNHLKSCLFFSLPPTPTPFFVVYCCGPVRLRSKHSWSLSLAWPFLRPPIIFHQSSLLIIHPSVFGWTSFCTSFPSIIAFKFCLWLQSLFCCSFYCLSSVTRFPLLLGTLRPPFCIARCENAVLILLRTQHAASESKLCSTISPLKISFSFFLFLQMYVYTVNGFAFQLDCWGCYWLCMRSEQSKKWTHRMWSEDYTMINELKHGRINYTVIDEWHEWGYEARPCDICEPILWWCDICR